MNKTAKPGPCGRLPAFPGRLVVAGAARRRPQDEL